MAARFSLKVGQKFAMAFGIVILLSLVSAVYSRYVMGDLADQTKMLVSDRMVKVRQLATINENVDMISQSVRNLLLFPEDEHQRTHIAAVHKAVDKNTEIYAALDKSTTDARSRELLAATEQARAKFGAELKSFEAFVGAREFGKALDLLTSQLKPAQEAYQQQLARLSDSQYELMAGDGRATEKEATTATIAIAVMFLISTAAASALAYYTTRSVTRPLTQAVDLANRVAQGDLSASVQYDALDEVGALINALSAMVMRLKELLGEVKLAADQIATGSTEIAAGTHDLSSRTEIAASNLQQTASSMEQLTSNVNQNLQAAMQANDMARSAADSARKGGDVVSQVVSTMGDINQSSRKIGDIISVIDGIAFQTNILALNAAVEAARAGEQGRGFAVVASEVRSLAQRSAQAAKEIKSLINASLEKVEGGSRLVDEAGQTMQDIVSSVVKVTDLMAEITTAANEQSSGIHGVNQAITQLDQSTQQNAALVEQSTAATESLQGQSSRLSQAVSVFRL